MTDTERMDKRVRWHPPEHMAEKSMLPRLDTHAAFKMGYLQRDLREEAPA